MSWVVSKRKPDFVGRRSLARSDTQRADRKHLIGLLPLDPTELLPEGAALVVNADAEYAVGTHGHVTSSYYSATLGRTFALGLLEGGRQRVDSVVYAAMPDRTVAVKVVQPVFYDLENRRRDG
jgi:sarcosine oxidase subunit alpha